MTDNTMREALLKFGDENPSLDLDFRLHTHGKYLTQEKAIVASRAFKAGAAWQAARTVPEGWCIDRCSDESINVIKDGHGGANVEQNAEQARRMPEKVLWMLANDMLSAAPEPKP